MKSKPFKRTLKKKDPYQQYRIKTFIFDLTEEGCNLV